MFGKKKSAPPAAVSLAKNPSNDVVTDDLGRFPAEVDSNPSRERAQERALRAVSLVAIVAGMMCIALIMMIITLFPLQKVYPYLVTFKDQDNQVVSIEPMSIEAPGMLYATEDNVRDYVIQRHTFVPIVATMSAQWGADSRLAARTTPDLYAKFADAARSETERMMTAGYARTLDINSVNRIAADTWQVGFTTYDALPTNAGTLSAAPFTAGQPGSPVTGPAPAPGTSAFAAAQEQAQQTVERTNNQTWIATMRVDYLPQNVTYDKRLLNPLGFTVTDYSVSRSAR